jgi:hypothetical protein
LELELPLLCSIIAKISNTKQSKSSILKHPLCNSSKKNTFQIFPKNKINKNPFFLFHFSHQFQLMSTLITKIKGTLFFNSVPISFRIVEAQLQYKPKSETLCKDSNAETQKVKL